MFSYNIFSSCKNMKKPYFGLMLLAGVSVLGFSMISAPAIATSQRTSDQNDVPQYSSEEVEEGLNETKEAVSETAENVSESVQETYQDIKKAFSDDNRGMSNPVKINMNTTASGMLGKPVYNESGERVAVVRDIILNRDGKAVMVVLGDGDWLGLGKLAAFDYRVITKTNKDGDIIAPLTEAMIDDSVPFSYQTSEEGSNVKMVPKNGYSVSELLDSGLLDSQGQRTAEIENISFNNGRAEWLVVGFGQILGLGGEKAAMDFDDPDLLSDKEGKPYFKLSATQSKKFEAFKDK